MRLPRSSRRSYESGAEEDPELFSNDCMSVWDDLLLRVSSGAVGRTIRGRRWYTSDARHRHDAVMQRLQACLA